MMTRETQKEKLDEFIREKQISVDDFTPIELHNLQLNTEYLLSSAQLLPKMCVAIVKIVKMEEEFSYNMVDIDNIIDHKIGVYYHYGCDILGLKVMENCNVNIQKIYLTLVDDTDINFVIDSNIIRNYFYHFSADYCCK